MKQNENENPSGDGTDFIKQQSDLDEAKNERAKSDKQERPGPSAKKQDDDTVKTDVSHKKTGGGKQISPGT